MKLKIGPWRPDLGVYDNPALVNVRNAIPAAGRWLPQPSLGVITEQTITAPVQGLFTAARNNGSLDLFVAFGGNIYRVPSRGGELEVATNSELSDGYSDLPEARWRFAQFGDQLLVTNFFDEIQGLDLVLGGNFQYIADASEDVPRARYIAIVLGIPTVAYTFDPVDLEDGYQVRWCGFTNGLPDSSNWNRSVETQADSQRLSEIGIITGLTGGEFGLVIGESGIALMSRGDNLFRFDTIERRIGCRTPNSVIQYRSATYFWSSEGWARATAQGVQLIAVEKIDRFFAEDRDENFDHKMWATVESRRGHLLWAYCAKGHNGEPNRLLRYAVDLDEWSISDVDIQALGGGKTFGLTLDDPFFNNLDEFTGSLDDPTLWSSLPQTIAVSANRVQAFIGSPMTARFETGEFAFGGEANRSIIRRSMPRGQGGTSTVSFSYRDRVQDPEVWTSDEPAQANGWHRHRVPGRTHRCRITRRGNWADLVDTVILGEGAGRDG